MQSAGVQNIYSPLQSGENVVPLFISLANEEEEEENGGPEKRKPELTQNPNQQQKGGVVQKGADLTSLTVRWANVKGNLITLLLYKVYHKNIMAMAAGVQEHF